MQLGIHLPHIGRKAGPEAIRRAAVQAEELGFADVWVSEHIIVPKDASYPPSPNFWDPVLTLDLGRRLHARCGSAPPCWCCRCAIRCHWQRNWRHCRTCPRAG